MASNNNSDGVARRAERNNLFFEGEDIVMKEDEEKTALLVDYWESGLTFRNYTWIATLKFLVLFGANPQDLRIPEKINEHLKLPKSDLDDATKFYDTAQKSWRMENGELPYVPKFREANNVYELLKVKDHMFAVAIDGGGIRGLVSALILRFVSKRIFGNEDIGKRVHWLAGSSTGSILALALATASDRFVPSKCMALYWKLRNKIFIKDDSFHPTQLVAKLVGQEEVMKRFNMREKRAKNLLSELKTTFQTKTFEKVDIFSQQKGDHRPHVSVTALNVTDKPARLCIFENYKEADRHFPHETFFYQAARASSAAPSYFNHYKHPGTNPDGRAVEWKFVDGGLSANCPADVLLCEIDKYALETGKESKRMTILSVGTGRHPTINGYGYAEGGYTKKASDFTDLMISQVSDGDGKVLDCVRVQCKRRKNIGFFRLNPENFDFSDEVRKKGVDLAECKPEVLIKMLWSTLNYITDAQQTVDELGQQLIDSFE